MKKLSIFLCVMLFLFGGLGIANATLWDRGGGLIYDDVLNITWLQNTYYAATELTDARRDAIISAVGSVDGHTLVESDFIKSDGEYTGLMSWWGALAWVDQLEYYDSVRGVTYDDWRLPRILPVDGLNLNYDMSYDGSTDFGFNISAPGTVYAGSTSSEMAYMYYNNLGNVGMYDTDGTRRPAGEYGLKNTGPFDNLRHGYWSSTEDSLAGHVLFFYFTSGRQTRATKTAFPVGTWAVRDGDVPPVPNPVNIDIIPKTCPNECPIKGGGSVEVAILGTVDLDVNDIDIASVRLEGVPPVKSSLKDKSSPVVPPPTDCECTTEGRDSFIDLCLKFDKKAIITALGEVTVDQEYVLTLSGVLNDGMSIEGKDCIVFVKKGTKD